MSGTSRAAFVTADGSLTFAQFALRSRETADALAIQAGQRVGMVQGMGLRLVELLGACAAAGAVAVPLNPKLPEWQLQRMIDDADPHLLIKDGRVMERRSDVELSPEGDAYLVYTSGTSGEPKGVCLTREGQLANARSMVEFMHITASDRVLNPLPLCHVGGLALMEDYLLAGATQYLLPASAELIEQERITHLAAVPAILRDLGECTSLRAIFYSGGSLRTEELERFGPMLHGVYGMTECGSGITYLTPEEHWRIGSVGRAAPHAALRLAQDEEVEVQTRSAMREYWRRPEETAAAMGDGWIRTGDMGRLDEDGYLYLIDRKKDVIKSGGENVYSRLVEAALLEHPLVADVAVVGLPDERWGEAVTAVVVGQATEAELDEWCRQRLAGFQRPKRYVFMAALPRNESGKVLKRDLRVGLALLS